MVGGVKRKILSEIILWSLLRVVSFESRATQGPCDQGFVAGKPLQGY